MRRRLTALGFLLSTLSLLATPLTAYANSYDVNASVAFPAPTQAATFSNNLDGRSVDSPQITLTGTCEAITPNGIVSIWRNGVSIGSGPCNGTFNVTVMLIEGLNTLIARSSSISSQYGPDSSSISIWYVLPPNAQPTAPVPTQSNDPPSKPALEAGIVADLVALPVQTFGVMDLENEVALDINVEGGRSPYTIRINWGDGSEETKVVEQLGVYRFTHVYAKSGTYTVNGFIRDVLGAITTFSYAVVSENTPITGDLSTNTQIIKRSNTSMGTWAWLIATVAASLLVAGLGFKLGLASAAHNHVANKVAMPRKRIKK